MRTENFTKNEYYYLTSRGSDKDGLFLDESDRARFVFLLTHFQSPIRIYNTSWYTHRLLKTGLLSTKPDRIELILKQRNVIPLAFALMPGAFHLIVKNLKDHLLSAYMQRILTAYSKHFNSKYHKHGHVFANPFRAIRIKPADLINFSAYIHKSPGALKDWGSNYSKYPWSSYLDYTDLNRWSNLVDTDTVLKQFKNQSHYKEFVSNFDLKSMLL